MKTRNSSDRVDLFVRIRKLADELADLTEADHRAMAVDMDGYEWTHRLGRLSAHATQASRAARAAAEDLGY